MNKRSVLQWVSGIVALLTGTTIDYLIRTDTEEIRTVPYPEKIYDYVIVGGGTAGSLLASQLARFSNYTVLVIEAGGKMPQICRIPLLVSLMARSAMDWQFMTEPQDFAMRGFVDRRLAFLRGKALGGSSSMNGNIFYWPTPEDMERWSDIAGDTKWGFQNFRRYLRDIEDARDVENPSNDRGHNGGIRVMSYPCNTSILCEAFLAAAKHNGHKIHDLNGDNPYGFMPAQLTIHNGQKWTSVQGYLKRTAQDLPHQLHIVINALATKVRFSGPRATSVSLVLSDGSEMTVAARKEIILSAGAVQTPQLLMLSGIGPRHHLESMGIKVKRDLPVGNNLLDHPRMFLYFTVDEKFGLTTQEMFSPETWKPYLEDRRGLPGRGILQALGRIPRPNGKLGYLSSTLASIPAPDPILMNKLFNYEIITSYRQFADAGNVTAAGFIIEVEQLLSKSRGTIRLKSTNPADPPLIDPRYLEDEEDLDVLVEGIRHVDELSKSPSMRRARARLFIGDFPECRAKYGPPSVESSGYLKCWLRQAASSSWHPCGTARMGKSDNPRTVVDSDFRVVGVDGLRVVDASVFPENISGNIQGTVLAIARMAADLILKSS